MAKIGLGKISKAKDDFNEIWKKTKYLDLEVVDKDNNYFSLKPKDFINDFKRLNTNSEVSAKKDIDKITLYKYSPININTIAGLVVNMYFLLIIQN